MHQTNEPWGDSFGASRCRFKHGADNANAIRARSPESKEEIETLCNFWRRGKKSNNECRQAPRIQNGAAARTVIVQDAQALGLVPRARPIMARI